MNQNVKRNRNILWREVVRTKGGDDGNSKGVKNRTATLTTDDDDDI